jgi:hypothetical protein
MASTEAELASYQPRYIAALLNFPRQRQDWLPTRPALISYIIFEALLYRRSLKTTMNSHVQLMMFKGS